MASPLAAALMPDPNNIGMSEADYGGWGSTWGRLKGGAVAQLLAEPFRKGAGLLGAMQDYSANEFPGTFGVTQQSTDYDPRREAAGWAAGTAMNMVGVPAMTGGVPADALGSAAKGIKAYHGSPHDFDRFDMSRIGTGEGAQAYGHGLYFAENEGVARQYREMLSGLPKTADGDLFSKLPWAGRSAQKWGREALDDAIKSGAAGDDAIRLAIDDLSKRGNMASASHVRQPYYDAANALGGLLGKKWEVNPGRMYEVNINARPEEFLDWDKPLAQQPSTVRNVVDPRLKADFPDIEASAPWIKGNEVWQAVARTEGKNNASSALREAGIPGIRYLDQGSRNAGQGSSNYVVFDDKLIDILKKYGLFGMAPVGASQMGDQQ
jgi:hypothetical protein